MQRMAPGVDDVANRAKNIRLAGLLVLALLMAGCTALSLSSSMMPRETRQAEALRRVDRAVEALKTGDATGANRLLTEATALMESIGGGRGEIAQRLMERGRPETAVLWLEPLTREKETADDPMIWGMLARAAAKAGNPRKDAEKRAEDLAAALLKTAGQDGGDPRDKEERARRFVRVGLHYLEQEGQSAQAIQAFREAVRLLPRPETWNALGYTLADRGETATEFHEAVQLTKKAVDQAPGNGIILDSYGWALFKRGSGDDDLEGARRVLREAAELAPEVPEIRYHLALVYWRLGLTREAALELDRALLLRPTFSEAERARTQLRIRWGV